MASETDAKIDFLGRVCCNCKVVSFCTNVSGGSAAIGELEVILSGCFYAGFFKYIFTHNEK